MMKNESLYFQDKKLCQKKIEDKKSIFKLLTGVSRTRVSKT